MNDRQLRYFIAVAEELSFSRAARRLNVSQPPLSMQIKAIEQSLGTQLLARTRHKVELTPAGSLLLDQARKAIAELELADQVVRRSIRGELGLIRMGFTGSVPMLDVFSRLMRTYRTRYPDVRLELQHMSTRRQLTALADDQLDVGVLRPPFFFQPGPGIQVHQIWSDRLLAFIPSDHPLAAGTGPIGLAEMADHPFVGIAPEVGCGMHDHLMTICGSAGFTPRVVQEGRELSVVLGLVAAGIGVSVLPECYARIGVSGVVHRPLASEAAVSRFLVAMRSRNLPPFLSNFLDVAREISPEFRPPR